MATAITSSTRNNDVWFNSISNRGIVGWIIAVILTGFYICLYWYPQALGYQAGTDGSNTGFIALFNPLSHLFKGRDASQWFVYGTLYTFFVLTFGFKFLYKYRDNAYQTKRTIIVMIAQLFLAYLIPEILAGLNYTDATIAGDYQGWYDTDFKNIWPLD